MPYAVVGANSVILPGVVIGKGASVGALSLVNRFVPDFDIVTGNPIRRIGIRGSKIINEHESGITDV
jgi:galactoside O-acetyltransferase